MNTKTVLQFAIGPVGGALLGLITLPVITWFFSQEDIGRLAMLQVTISFSILLFSLGLDQAYVREFHEVADKPKLLKAAVLPGFSILVALALIILLYFGSGLSSWLFGVPKLALSNLIVISVLASFKSRFLSLVLRMNSRGLAFSMSQVLPKVFLLAVIGLYIAFGVDKNLLNLVIANTLATLAVCLIFSWNTRAEITAAIRSDFDREQFHELLKFGAPLILGGLAFWGLTAVDKVFLRALSSFEELGLYSVSVSFAAAAIILQSIFSTVWAPTVYKWASAGEGLDKVHKVTRFMLAAVVLLFILVGLFSWLVTHILPKEYEAVRWIVVACFGYPLLYTLSETTVVGIGISRRSSFAMLAAVIAFSVNFLGNWLLIPTYGAAGAAVSTCIAFLIFFVLRTEFAIRLWKPIPRLQLYAFTFVCVLGASFHALHGTNDNFIYFSIYWLAMFLLWGKAFWNEIRLAFGFTARKLFK